MVSNTTGKCFNRITRVLVNFCLMNLTVLDKLLLKDCGEEIRVSSTANEQFFELRVRRKERKCHYHKLLYFCMNRWRLEVEIIWWLKSKLKDHRVALHVSFDLPTLTMPTLLWKKKPEKSQWHNRIQVKNLKHNFIIRNAETQHDEHFTSFLRWKTLTLSCNRSVAK